MENIHRNYNIKFDEKDDRLDQIEDISSSNEN